MPTTCPCCGTTYDPLDDMRFRAGKWVDKVSGAVYEQICERCVRDGRCDRVK